MASTKANRRAGDAAAAQIMFSSSKNQSAQNSQLDIVSQARKSCRHGDRAEARSQATADHPLDVPDYLRGAAP